MFASAVQPADGDEHFKYGSVGIESEEGLPYWIWQVLPRMFADKLPGRLRVARDYLGARSRTADRVLEEERARLGPRRGELRVLPHRDLSHRALMRRAMIVPGGATTLTRPQAFSRFLEAAAADPRFNAADMLEAIGKIDDAVVDRVV